MADMTQVDKIISEVNALEEKEKILFFHKIEELFDDFDDQTDNDIPIDSVFGLWKDRAITKETLQKTAWRKT